MLLTNRVLNANFLIKKNNTTSWEVEEVEQQQQRWKMLQNNREPEWKNIKAKLIYFFLNEKLNASWLCLKEKPRQHWNESF